MTGLYLLLGGILAFVLFIGVIAWRQDRLRHAHHKS